jgi:GNAT superfamily N-acetyltransferase
MNPAIRELQSTDAESVSALSLASFERYIAGSWSSSACAEYRTLVSAPVLSKSIESCAYAVGAFNDQRLVGFLLLPRPNLIQMFFVAPESVRQGIGSCLWRYARDEVEVRFPEARTIELNASPYALAFYRSLGFVPISKEFESKGFRATRMACWLAARALDAEL